MIQPQYAQPYAQGTPSANAVNIQIFEPKAYASPQAAQPNYTNQLYNYPQASLYGPQPQAMYPMPQAMPYPQMMPQYMPYGMPQYNMPYPQAGYPGAEMAQQQPQVYTVPPQIVSPQPQEMPAPAIEQQPVQQEAAPAPTQAEQQAAPVTVEQPAQPAQTIDVNGLVTGLQSNDPAVQEKTITEIANYSQSEPAVAQQVLNEQVMNSLANIVAADNSQLQGPTPEQQAALDKAMKGQQLTPEETQLAQQLSPKAAADKNKIIAMFTLAMLQKNQRDELDAYITSQGGANIAPLSTDNLIGFNEIKNAIQADSNPEVRLAGIQAISYVAKPEDAQTVQAVLQNSLNDSEPLIQQAAQEVLAKFGAAPAPAADAQQAQQTQETQQPQQAQQQNAEIIQMPQSQAAAQAPADAQTGDTQQMAQAA